MKRIVAVFVCLLNGANIHAEPCQIVDVTDGDTLKAQCDSNRLVKIRMVDIDAPEKKQAFGQKLKQSLADMCFGRSAELLEQGKDRYGRTLARVKCNGVDANAEQVRRGMAWVYDKYVTDRSLYAVQDSARARAVGLWLDKAPVAPWEWRHGK